MGRQTRKSSVDKQPDPAASKRARTEGAGGAGQARLQQRGIAELLAAQGARATTDMVLEVEQPRAQLERRLAEELSGHGEAYLQMWADKCYGIRGEPAGAASSKGGATKRARRLSSAAASLAGDETQLDEVGKSQPHPMLCIMRSPLPCFVAFLQCPAWAWCAARVKANLARGELHARTLLTT